MKEKIDFVIAWVDGNDPAWKAKKDKWIACQEKSDFNELSEGDSRTRRYMDWNLLKYWFRGVDKFAPWVNKVHFITDGQIPEWLNVKHEKLNIVNHRDYIPEQYLPTFNSIPIELNMYRIKDLEEHFVYFNDDMFLTNFVKPEDFFLKGKPLGLAIQNVKCSRIDETLGFSQLVSTAVINKHFDKHKVIKENFWLWFNLKYGINVVRNFLLLPWKQFPDFYIQHLPSNFLKSTFEKMWDVEYEILNQASKSRVRNSFDVNQWIFLFWQICEGNITPSTTKLGKAFTVGYSKEEDEKIYTAIRRQQYKMICIGEYDKVDDFEKNKQELDQSFFKILEDKCSYEI